VKGHIRFENVWFAYDEERWVLQGLNFEIQPGEKIGVVGHTGAGKTTLIQLLLRFHEPQRGRILLDGRDLRDYDKRSLRATIGLIQQDAFLFSGDAEENLGLGRVLDAESRARVEPALKKLGYPHWLGTAEQPALELLERGSNLSMGERQVLAFARAASIGPRLWILDEATANIDPETERALGQVLEASSGGFTSIFIAHRLATVREANRIFVLHRGKLAEEGTHEQLLQVNGLYARLWRFQEPVDNSEAKESSPAPAHPPGA
jgi:ATP-binding cassette subfamily B multidrug efflux pump